MILGQIPMETPNPINDGNRRVSCPFCLSYTPSLENCHIGFYDCSRSRPDENQGNKLAHLGISDLNPCPQTSREQNNDNKTASCETSQKVSLVNYFYL
jgi:hypothetical protein